MLATNRTFFVPQPPVSVTRPRYTLNLILANQTHDYLLELEADKKWDELFHQTQYKLAETARGVRVQIAEGKAEPMDYERL